MGSICTQRFQPEGLTHTISAIAHRNGEIQTRVHAWDAHISTAVQDVMQLRLFVPTEEVARHFATCNRSSRTPLGLTWCHVATSSNAWQNSPPCSCKQANYILNRTAVAFPWDIYRVGREELESRRLVSR